MRMRKVFLLLLFLPLSAGAQSPFDGTWLLDPANFKPPREPAEFLLADGMFRCTGCTGNISIKADGQDHSVPEGPYWNTASVHAVDGRTVEIITRQNGRMFYSETDTVSPKGSELVQLVKDTTEAEAVTTETRFRRIKKGPVGAHAVSGAWRAYQVEKSRNSLIIKYKCTADGFSAETPLGEKYDAKFDGKFVLTEDDPALTMVAVKRIDERTVEVTIKRGEELAGTSRLSVSPDGKTLRGVFFDAQGKETGTVVMHKQPAHLFQSCPTITRRTH
jgi:hypothetical protein